MILDPTCKMNKKVTAAAAELNNVQPLYFKFLVSIKRVIQEVDPGWLRKVYHTNLCKPL